jgi:NADPH-dependent glutamate synthase beta subunit-like oxidoreductase
MAKLRKGDIDGAARIIMRVNPLAAITGRVCAHFCQETCNRNNYDETVAIGNAERFVGDYIIANSAEYFVAPQKSSGKKVAIVGSGPAGLSAAYFLRKEGHSVVIFERKKEAGGILQYAIPAYRLPKEYVRKTVAALKNMGIDIRTSTEIGKDVLPKELEQGFDKVFYDTGAWGKSIIGFDGEEFTVFGLEFLTEVKNWMNGKLGQNVIVVGGGNVAMDAATTAKRLGAKKVTVVCLETSEEMPAGIEDIKRAEEQGVEIINSYGVNKIIRDGNRIKGIDLIKCTSVFDENVCFAPVYDLDCSMKFECDSVLMAAGQKVDLSFLDEKYQLELNARELVAVDEKYQTSKKDVYAGGDMISGPSTVINAIAAGHGAADAINGALGVEKEDPCDISLEPAFLKFDEVGIMVQEATELQVKLAEERTLDTEDQYTGFTWEQVKAEASRCQNCGCLAVNPSDLAPVLVALDAIVKTNDRQIRAIDFFTKSPTVDQVLNKGELVREIKIPACDEYKTAYRKLPIKDGTNFAVVSVASAYKIEDGRVVDARIVFGGVAPVPYRAREVEAFVNGKGIDESVAALAGELACRHAVLLKGNAFKLRLISSFIKDSLLNSVN